MKLSYNLICRTMALNSDIQCLLLNSKINKNQHVYWMYLPNKKFIFFKAIKYNKLDIVKLLLPHVDASADDNYAIEFASRNGHTEVVKMLLKCDKVDASDHNNAAILWASHNGHTEIVKMLLKCDKVDASDQNNYTIIWACNNGHTEIVKLLLECDKVDVTAQNNLAIIYASQNGHTEVVKLLLDWRRSKTIGQRQLKDDKVDAKNNCAIICASENGHTEIVKLLMQDNRVDIRVDNDIIIRNFIKCGNLEFAKFMIDYILTKKN